MEWRSYVQTKALTVTVAIGPKEEHTLHPPHQELESKTGDLHKLRQQGENKPWLGDASLS